MGRRRSGERRVVPALRLDPLAVGMLGRVGVDRDADRHRARWRRRAGPRRRRRRSARGCARRRSRAAPCCRPRRSPRHRRPRHRGPPDRRRRPRSVRRGRRPPRPSAAGHRRSTPSRCGSPAPSCVADRSAASAVNPRHSGYRSRRCRPLILDVDTGVDDMVALLLRRRLTRGRPDRASTCVDRQRPRRLVTRNTSSALELAGAGGVGGRAGRANAAGSRRLATRSRCVHGPEGLGAYVPGHGAERFDLGARRRHLIAQEARRRPGESAHRDRAAHERRARAGDGAVAPGLLGRLRADGRRVRLRRERHPARRGERMDGSRGGGAGVRRVVGRRRAAGCASGWT